MLSLIRIALRNVMRNRRRSLITLSAVFLALGVMTSVRGFLNGLQETIRENVVFGQTGALQVHTKGFSKTLQPTLNDNIPSDDAFLAKILAVPGVKAATPRILFGGMFNQGDETAFALFTALDPSREWKVCPRRADQISGGKSFDASTPRASIIAAPELQRRIGVKVGGTATILTNDKDGVLNALDVGVIGTYGQAGIPMPDKKIGFVPIGFAQELLRMEGRALEIAIAVEDLDKVDEVAARLRAALGPDYEVQTWHDVAAFVDEIVANQNRTLSIVSFIFLFVALLGVANTMVMSVLERTREIGTMMSVGVRRRQILALFLVEAGILGLLGGVLGSAAGMGFVGYFGHFGFTIHLPGQGSVIVVHPFLTPPYFLFIFALSTVGALLAALLPALRASRLRPVEALASV